MSEEQYLREQLAALHKSYMKTADPIIKRLGEIEACKPRPPVMIGFTPDQRRQIEAMLEGMKS